MGSSIDEELPLPDVFARALGLGEDEDGEFSLLRAQVLARLRRELKPDTLDLILVERVSHLYAHIRHREGGDGFAHDRAFKETQALLVSMVDTLRKARDSKALSVASRDELAAEAVASMSEAVKVLPADQQQAVLARLASLLDA